MTRRLPNDVDDTSILLRLHDGQHCFYHCEKSEDLVAQLAIQDVERRGLDCAAQMRACVVDENIDAAKLICCCRYETLDGILIGNVGHEPEHAAFCRQFDHCSVKLARVATANCNRTSFLE